MPTIAERYSILENHLVNRRWRDADETNAYLISSIAGLTRALDSEDVRNFPSRDLRLINRLWSDYSGGRFGFSAQKKIYIYAGNPLDSRCHDREFYKFTGLVGWNTYNHDGTRTIFTYDISAPLGHLPGLGFIRDRLRYPHLLCRPDI